MKRLAVVVASCLLAAVAARAAAIHVDADAAGANDGSSWGDAHADLQSALAAASSGDEIWVAEGTYKPTSGTDRTISFALVTGVAVYGGFIGTETARGDRDPAANVTILSGDIRTPGVITDNSCHVVVGASNATLDGFTVTGGNANGESRDTCGAGMYNHAVADLKIVNCTFSANSARLGGGIYNEFSSPTITGCTFLGNGAYFGGGMYNFNDSSPSLTSCTFAGNSAGLYGGAMYNAVYSSPPVTNCTFSGNRAFSGGGMYDFNNSSPSVGNCTFSGNLAGDSGGGMHNHSSSPSVTNSVLWGDSAPVGPEIHDDTTSGASSVVAHSDVEGGHAGKCNINTDPLYINAKGADKVAGTADDDLRLRVGSPCIDAANGAAVPPSDKDGNPRYDDPDTPNAGVGAVSYADLGAHEFLGVTVALSRIAVAEGDRTLAGVWAVLIFAGLALCAGVLRFALWRQGKKRVAEARLSP